MAPAEDLAAIDWNQDGDRAIACCSTGARATSAPARREHGGGACWPRRATTRCCSASESERGGDEDGDGDADDLVLELYDARHERPSRSAWRRAARRA
jgi:hypothetical protein